MPTKRPSIGIFFAGGGELALGPRSSIVVREKDDLPAWLHEVPELRMLADVHPVFVMGEEQRTGATKTWAHIARSVWGQQNNIDGAVILHPTLQLAQLSAGLDVVLPNFPKPIVVTGSHVARTQTDMRRSYEYRALGVRSNLINAIHAATLDLAGTALLYDTEMLAADDATREAVAADEVFRSFSASPLASVNVGIHLNTGRSRRDHAGDPIFVPQLAARVGVVRWSPLVDEQVLLAQVAAAKDAVIVRAEDPGEQSSGLARFLAKLQERPVFFYADKQKVDIPNNVVGLFGIAFETAFARVSAVVGRGLSPQMV